MQTTFAALPTMDDLRRHVLTTLCARDALDASQTPLQQAVMTRRGQPCGLFFQVQGPRLMKNYAIWTSEENRILFYDSTGLRYAETRLSEGPEADKIAA